MKKFSAWLFLMLHQEEVTKVRNYVRNEINEYQIADTVTEQNCRREKLVGIYHVMRLIGVPEK